MVSANVADRPASPERDCCPQIHLINDLSYQVAGHQRRLALRSDNVADVKDLVETTNLRTITIEGVLADVGERVGHLETVQNETNVRLDRLETAQNETNVRLDHLETAQTATNLRLDQMDGRLNRIEAGQMEHADLLARILAAVEGGGKGRKKS